MTWISRWCDHSSRARHPGMWSQVGLRKHHYEQMAPHSSTLAWKIPWTEEAADHGVAKSRKQLSDFTFTFHFHAWEKEMATHSSVFAWRIPGIGEPGGLPSMGLHRVAHDWSDLAAAATAAVEVMEFQLRYFKSWKMMLWKCCTQYASKFGTLSSGHRTGKGQFSF